MLLKWRAYRAPFLLALTRMKRAGTSTGRDTETPARRTMSQDSMIDRMLADLHELERKLTIPSIAEAIRLLESEKFHRLTSEHIRAIANYQPIRIEDEWFFDKAFSTGKEVAASLAYAEYIGREVVLEDLVRLRAAASGPSDAVLTAAPCHAPGAPATGGMSGASSGYERSPPNAAAKLTKVME